MSANTSIQWTDRTWNPVRGCSVISPGCVECYAMKQAHRFSGAGKPYEGLTKLTTAGPQWTGVVRTVESALLEPLSWRKPSRVFVNSMSDLFHEGVPFKFIDRVFAVMGLASNHTFQILTKRADRMRQYLTSRPASPTVPGEVNIATESGLGVYHVRWPLPNVWLGVSVENQKYADERIPLLLQTPAAVRFISAEPLLGPLQFETPDGGNSLFTCQSNLTNEQYESMSADDQMHHGDCCEAFAGSGEPHYRGIDWVIVGGESGPGARPFDVASARSIVQQCKAASVPVFVKQLGAKPEDAQKCGDCDPCLSGERCYQQYNIQLALNDRKGGDMAEWSEDLRVREFPKVVA